MGMNGQLSTNLSYWKDILSRIGSSIVFFIRWISFDTVWSHSSLIIPTLKANLLMP